MRAGELTAVWVPDKAHKAIRDVVRARRQAKQDLVSAKNTLKSFLLRHDRWYPGKAIWDRMHWRWLSDQRFAFAHEQFVYEEHKRRIHELEERCARLEQILEEAALDWPLAPVVTALQALRGIKFIAAVTRVAEIGDLHRFDSPKKLMAWLGLVPAEHSSETRTRRGELTRTGNVAARDVLIESAWQYRYPAREGRVLRESNTGLPNHVRAVTWEAQTRLCAKFRRLAGTGKHAAKIVVAVARELAGFIWDIACHTPVPASRLA